MNLFRLVADVMHLASIFILLLKIQKTRSCSGVSFKTQVLYCIVYLTRYLDLFFHFVSLYNTLMKIFFIASSIYVVYLMQYRFKGSYDASMDTFQTKTLLIPCAILSLLFHYHLTLVEVLWSFSIYLEAVAILPQLFMITRSGEAETITTHYIFALGAYRALYLLNWMWRLYFEGHKDWIVWIAGVIQTGLYLDFFYIYTTRVLKGKKFELPA